MNEHLGTQKLRVNSALILVGVAFVTVEGSVAIAGIAAIIALFLVWPEIKETFGV
jgi:hypothetical protein